MYKLRNGVELPKEFKIKVNPEQSEALQLYLFSIGVKWFGEANAEYKEDRNFIIVYSLFLFRTRSEKGFNNIEVNLILFDKYFEKVTNQFPEKWCIEVTEDNCNELNIWMHRNWKNYEGYRDTWCTVLDNYNKYFYSESVFGSCHSINDLISGFTLITTQQFREKFGIAKINETEIKAMESNIDFWHERANYHKQRCKYLRRERYEMSKEIEQLKSELELYNALKDLSNTMKKFLQ